jgi:hypothetical protein
MWWVWFVLLMTPTTHAEVNKCTYHQRYAGVASGALYFEKMWKSGCESMLFLVYSTDARIQFTHSSCAPYNLDLIVAQPQEENGEWTFARIWRESRKSWVMPSTDHRFADALVLWCGKWHPKP